MQERRSSNQKTTQDIDNTSHRTQTAIQQCGSQTARNQRTCLGLPGSVGSLFSNKNEVLRSLNSQDLATLVSFGFQLNLSAKTDEALWVSQRYGPQRTQIWFCWVHFGPFAQIRMKHFGSLSSIGPKQSGLILLGFVGSLFADASKAVGVPSSHTSMYA